MAIQIGCDKCKIELTNEECYCKHCYKELEEEIKRYEKENDELTEKISDLDDKITELEAKNEQYKHK